MYGNSQCCLFVCFVLFCYVFFAHRVRADHEKEFHFLSLGGYGI